ncbi:MAG TPA: glycoside hydrolase family 3 N-terminal domain-containing protein, partial [Beijerinckiaceae bacterium]
MDDVGADARLMALAGRMTLTEKIGQLTMLADGLVETGPPGPHNPFTMIEEGRVGSLLNVWGPELVREAQRRAVEETRLGVPLFFGLDVLHGHRTIHPVPLAEAGAFDRELWEATARDAATEAAADGVHMTFGPMLDVCRDARWGRIVESAGEDPYVTSEFARARVRGFQTRGADGRMLLAACAKHFCAYGASLAGRDYAEADVSERALEEVYLPPFRAAVEEGVQAVMPAFIDVAGVAMTAHERLLRRKLREAWGFGGLVVSDYNAVGELVAHGVAADLAEAAALALRAGVDIDMMSEAYPTGLPQALARGLVTMEQIDDAVLRVLRFKHQMGLFENPYRNMEETPRGAPAPERRALARAAARASIVLAENRDAFLPLRDARRIAVIGPLADRPEDQLGPWASAGDGAQAVTHRAAIEARFPDMRYASGGGFEDVTAEEIAQARRAAEGADAALLFLGESRMMSGEATSRTRPELPAAQLELARAVLATGAPVVLTLCCGRPLAL